MMKFDLKLHDVGKMKKIYVQADEDVIDSILEMVKPHIGIKVNAVDLEPELKEDEDD